MIACGRHRNTGSALRRFPVIQGILLAGLVSCVPIGTGGIQGVDVSHHQAPLEWDALRRDGIRFAYVKATEGLEWTDPKYREYENAARGQGILVGAYHYFTLCSDPERQAMHFLATADIRPGDMAPMVDVEIVGNCLSDPDPETLRVNLGKFRAVIIRATGSEPVIYMTDWFRWKYFRTPPAGSRLWIRNLLWKPSERVPWAVWQYGINRPVGSSQRIDRNVLRGGEAELQALRYFPGPESKPGAGAQGQSGSTAAMGESAP